MMFSRISALVVLMLTVMSIQSHAQSDQSPSEIEGQIRDATIRAWIEVIKPRFIKAIDDQGEANQIEAAHLEIIQFSDINAWAGTKHIKMPIGFLITLNQLVDSQLIGYAEPSKYKLTTNYVQYIVDNYVAAQGGSPKAMQSFPQFARIPSQRVQEITSAPGYGDRKASFITDALSMILGHELGHILLHHKGYKGINPEEAREQESAADKFGYELAEKAGFQPMAALFTVFMVFATMEGGAVVADSSATHPAALCRISVLMQNELERMEAEPTAAASLKRIGMTMKQFKESVSQLEDACQP